MLSLSMIFSLRTQPACPKSSQQRELCSRTCFSYRDFFIEQRRKPPSVGEKLLFDSDVSTSHSDILSDRVQLQQCCLEEKVNVNLKQSCELINYQQSCNCSENKKKEYVQYVKERKGKKKYQKHRSIGELEIFRHSIGIILYIFIRVQQSLSLRKRKKEVKSRKAQVRKQRSECKFHHSRVITARKKVKCKKVGEKSAVEKQKIC